MTDSRVAPLNRQPISLISERTFAKAVAKYTDRLESSEITAVDVGTDYPFDDPLFDFIITCRSDEAAFETAPEIARKYRGVDVEERRAVERLLGPVDPRARQLSERYMLRWGYGPELKETVRGLQDLLRSRVSRGLCSVPVALCWLAHQAGLSAELGLFLEQWHAWKSGTDEQRERIENQIVAELGATGTVTETQSPPTA